MGLDGVAEGVPVVERLPPHAGPGGGGLAEVDGDHRRLDRDRPLHELREARPGGVGAVGKVLLDEAQDLRVGDEAALDHLGQPGPDVTRREGVEEGQVAQHRARLVEGAHQVLARRQVDAGLAAHRGVDHGQHRRGDADVADPAQPRGRDEPGEVGRRPAADAHHEIVAGEPGGRQGVPAAGEHLGGLRPFGVRDLDQGDGQPEAVREASGGGCHGGAVDHRDPVRVLHQAGQPIDGATLDVDLVGAQRGLHAHAHSAILSAARASATSAHPRPSVSTVWVARAS